MMDNAEILRGTLALYDWTESEMNRRRLAAIVDVQHSLIQRFERGFLLRGVDIQVTLDSNGFAGEGDITLFGELLHRFFALYADIHLFTQLTLILQPTGKCLQWTEHHSQRVPGLTRPGWPRILRGSIFTVFASCWNSASRTRRWAVPTAPPPMRCAFVLIRGWLSGQRVKER